MSSQSPPSPNRTLAQGTGIVRPRRQEERALGTLGQNIPKQVKAAVNSEKSLLIRPESVRRNVDAMRHIFFGEN